MGIATARAINNNIASLTAAYPDRFVSMGTVPLQVNGRRGIGLVVKELGFHGVEINTDVAARICPHPAYDLCSRRRSLSGSSFLIHPIGFTDAKRLINHYFNNVMGNPLESTIAVSHLIFGGVLDAHPGLKVVIPHGWVYPSPPMRGLWLMRPQPAQTAASI